MGTLPITTDSIKVMNGNLYVQGRGFTEKSKIFVNDQKLSTTMLSQYSLMATKVKIADGDEVTVGQSSSKREVLSYSAPIVYRETEHLVVTEDDFSADRSSGEEE